uniref:Exosome complex component 10 n=1 Tax=Scleropages formosus TaxID=113540 RepID=A0A8C9TC43_SCLFO
MAACGRIEMDTEENSGSQSVGAAGSGDAAMFSGFKDMDAFVKHGLGAVVAVTKAAAGLPQAGDEYDFYRSFPAFQSFCEAQGDRLLQCMSLLMRYHGCRAHSRDRNSLTGLEESFDLVVDSNDVILERAGILLDEASGVSRTQQPIMPVGFQPPKTVVSSWNRRGGDLAQRNTLETIRLLQAKNIQRPQLKFKEKVDNSNTPFVLKIFIKPNAIKPLSSYFTNKRLRKERPEDLDIPAALADFVHQQRTQEHMDDMFAHPYQYELDHLLMPESLMSKPEPQMYRPIDETPCKFIDSLEELVMLNEKLAKTTEFAVDLEHHSYRSFLGITCLMQISTRDEDFIIDTLELRSEMYILNETFTDPAITKVFHGADSDIEWLQKDFGLYVVNLFDTHQAARTLNLGRHSLDHLLRLYCSVDMDKRYQLADWRIRPLPQEMFEYARADTHYLLYTYDRIRLDLLEAANGQPTLIQVAWQKSKTISLKVYMKPIYTEHSYLELYRKQKTTFNTQQLTAFRLLYGWRDKLAREQDESTGYVLPNHMLTKISENLPKEPQGIIACCNPVPPLVRQQVNELHLLIQQARDMPLLKVRHRQPRVPLFGPHDISHVPESPLFDFSSSPGKSLIPSEKDTKQKKVVPLTVAQQKACSIMESFENPFRMYLPSKDNNIHISKTAKYDPSSKVYEISNRWKLQSIEQQKKEAEAQQEARARAREAAKREAARLEATKREGDSSHLEQSAPKAKKKQLNPTEKASKKAPPEASVPFKPFDYSEAPLKVFSGTTAVCQLPFPLISPAE